MHGSFAVPFALTFAVLLAAVVLAANTVGLATDDPGAVPTPSSMSSTSSPSGPTPSSGQTSPPPYFGGANAALLSEAQLLRASLGYATGSLQCPPASKCVVDTSVSGVGSVSLLRCHRISFDDPGPYFDTTRGASLLEAVRRACARLDMAERDFGAPAERPEWRQAFRDAFALLDKEPTLH